MIAIAAIGAITAVGDDAPNTMAGLLSELQLFDELPVRGSDGDRLTGAMTALSRKLKGIDRLGALGLVALAECAAKAPAGVRPPVLVCAPTAQDLGADPERLLAAITDDAAIATDGGRSRVFPAGRGAIREALGHAAALLGQGVPACYLVGVDSLCDPMRAERLLAQERLLEPANPEGVVPGEAGVALLLTRPSPTALALVAGIGGGREPEGDVATGRGLSAAFTHATESARVDPRALRALVHDACDRRHADELALATARAPFTAVGELRIFSPNDSSGQVGAASGPLSLAMTAFFSAEREIDGPALLAFLCDGTERAAVVVSPVDPSVSRVAAG